MNGYIIHNKINNTYFGYRENNGIKKHGFYKGNKDNVLVFNDLQSVNFVVQLLYDLRGYKSLVVTEYSN